VVACLAAVNDSCRRYIFDAMRGEFPDLLPGLRVHALSKHVADILPIADTPFLALAAVAGILVVVMLRT
jgi:hypothetical protein